MSTGYSFARDKTVIVWHLTREEGQYGFARRALRGHSHFVQVSDIQRLDTAFMISIPVAVATTTSHEHSSGECIVLFAALCSCAAGPAC